jgi:hypothetical protein
MAEAEVLPPPIVSGDYANTTIGASLSWRHGRWLEVRLRYEHNSEDVTGAGSGYNQNSVFLTVGYRPPSNQPVGTFQPGGNFPGGAPLQPPANAPDKLIARAACPGLVKLEELGWFTVGSRGGRAARQGCRASR